MELLKANILNQPAGRRTPTKQAKISTENLPPEAFPDPIPIGTEPLPSNPPPSKAFLQAETAEIKGDPRAEKLYSQRYMELEKKEPRPSGPTGTRIGMPVERLDPSVQHWTETEMGKYLLSAQKQVREQVAKKEPRSTAGTFEDMLQKIKSGEIQLKSVCDIIDLNKALSSFLSRVYFTDEGIYRKLCLQSYVR